jgi:hypothetical protein
MAAVAVAVAVVVVVVVVAVVAAVVVVMVRRRCCVLHWCRRASASVLLCSKTESCARLIGWVNA